MKWSTQKKLTGFIFVLPWIIGFLLFTLYPLIETIRYSFSDVRVQVGGVAMTGVGWKNYVQVLMGDTAFLTELPGYLQQIFLYVPMTLVFSVILSLLNHASQLFPLMRCIIFGVHLCPFLWLHAPAACTHNPYTVRCPPRAALIMAAIINHA